MERTLLASEHKLLGRIPAHKAGPPSAEIHPIQHILKILMRFLVWDA